MRLYHLMLLAVLLSVLTACAPTPEPSPVLISVEVVADGETQQVQLSPGSTVGEALDLLGITLETLDRVDPPSYTVLTDGAQIIVTRVWEEFEVEQVVIPFEQRIQPSEFLAEGEKQPLQLGENGLKEITYRRLFEDGEEVSKNAIKSVIVKEPVPQIMLVGVKPSYTPLPIPGRVLYLSQGNAMMLEGTTANRIPVITTGDLDGRVFALSEDGEWLLFTRAVDSEEVINRLWAARVTDPSQEIDLKVENIIHFADWVGSSVTRVAYSTVEPRQAAPGWQANNDLALRNFSVNGWVSQPEMVVETNSGGVYGWWGTDFAFSPLDYRVAFAGPDQVGILDPTEEEIAESVLDLIPYQTRGDWAWVPGVRWSPDSQVLFTVAHAAPSGAVAPEESPYFDLVAIPLGTGEPISMVPDVGMFAYPLPSPFIAFPSGERGYQVAYLQAVFPTQSDTSPYRVMVMDRDGSNRRVLFPPPEAPGVKPSKAWGVWSPQPVGVNGNYLLAVLYRGNIWLVDANTGESWQVTGDGQIDRLDWK